MSDWTYLCTFKDVGGRECASDAERVENKNYVHDGGRRSWDGSAGCRTHIEQVRWLVAERAKKLEGQNELRHLEDQRA